MKVCLDAGHTLYVGGKETPKFDDGKRIKEAEQNYPVMYRVEEYLKYNGIDVVIASKDINKPLWTKKQINEDLAERVRIANESKADIFISIHSNAITGRWQKYAKGIETYVYKKGYKAEKLANAIQSNLIKATGMYDRKVKEANHYVTKYTKMPAALVELGYMDYLPEAKQMKDPMWHDKYAKAIARGICEVFGVGFKDIELTPIISEPTATIDQMMQWAKSKNTSQEFINLASMYYTMAQVIGINPVMAYAQFAHETGFLYKIPSAAGLDASYHNPCGLKTTQGGGDYQASAHTKFKSWEDGISAHLDHIALYAGVRGYPKKDTLDPRHFSYIYGNAKYIEDLSGKWAPSKSYVSKILKYMKEIEEIQVEPVTNEELEKVTLRIKELEEENAKLTKEVFSKDMEIQELNNRIAKMKAGAQEIGEM